MNSSGGREKGRIDSSREESKAEHPLQPERSTERRVGRGRLERDRARALVWKVTLFPFNIAPVYSGPSLSTGDRIVTVWAGGHRSYDRAASAAIPLYPL